MPVRVNPNCAVDARYRAEQVATHWQYDTYMWAFTDYYDQEYWL